MSQFDVDPSFTETESVTQGLKMETIRKDLYGPKWVEHWWPDGYKRHYAIQSCGLCQKNSANWWTAGAG